MGKKTALSQKDMQGDEKLRVQALNSYKVLNMPLENELNGLARLAALSCNAPVAYISLIDDEKLWFKAKVGIELDELPRELSFCWQTIQSDGVQVINDVALLGNKEAAKVNYAKKKIRFYAAAPLISDGGFKIGTVAVIDFTPRELSAEQAGSLEIIAGEVMERLEQKLKYKDYESGVKRVLERRYTQLGHYHNSILNGTHYAVIFTNTKGIIKTFNAGAEKMLGYSHAEVVDRETPVIFHVTEELNAYAQKLEEEERRSVAPGFEALIAQARSGKTDVNEWTYVHKNGSTITVQLSVKNIQDEKEGVIGYLAIAEDVSEKSRIAKKLQHSEERHRLFFENSQGIMFTHNVTGELLSINAAGAEFLGYKKEELIARQVADLIPSFTQNKTAAYLGRLKTSGFDTGIVRLQHKDGSTRAGFYKNILINDGTKDIVIGNAIDISSRIELEKSLKKAKLLAEKNAAAKDQFLANMSHEIRTPMNAIIGFTGVLGRTSLDAEQAEYLGIIKSAGDNLLGLINDILDFSKIESGKIVFESAPFALVDTIEDIYKLLKVKAIDKDIEMNLHLGSDLPQTVTGDRLRLNQVLFNLIGNAIKFTERGEINIDVTLLEENKEECTVGFTITDTGIGIPEEQLENVFERFTQVSAETTRKYGGTGLGLSISKNLVTLQGGRLEVKSELGMGSRFSFHLPFKRSPEMLRDATHAKAGEQEAKDRTIKILLVEDNELNQKLAKKVVTDFGFVIDVADNGRLGVEKLKQNSYDVVLMDLQMPEMDGYQATRVIRNELRLAVPIIAMTAHSLVGEKEKCLAAGMNDYVSKPFKPDDLLGRIRQLAGGAESKGPLQQPLHQQQVDLEYLKELSGGSRDFEKEMIVLFLEKVPSDLYAIEKAINKGNPEVIRKTAHKLKSSFAMFTLNGPLDLLGRLDELAAGSAATAELMSQYTAITQQLDEIFSEMSALLKEKYGS